MKIMVKDIVEKATVLKNKHTDEKKAPVNYACIFSQSKDEYDVLRISHAYLRRTTVLRDISRNRIPAVQENVCSPYIRNKSSCNVSD